MKDTIKGIAKGAVGTYMGVAVGAPNAIAGTGLSCLLGMSTAAVTYFATGILMPKLVIGIAITGAVISTGIGIYEGVKAYKIIKTSSQEYPYKPTKGYRLGTKIGATLAAVSMVLGGYKLKEVFNNMNVRQIKTEMNQKANTPIPQDINKKGASSIKKGANLKEKGCNFIKI